MKKFTVEISESGYFLPNEEAFTIDEFQEIEAETAQEAIGFAIDWVKEHGLLAEQGTENPENYGWRAAEIAVGDWGEKYLKEWEYLE